MPIKITTESTALDDKTKGIELLLNYKGINQSINLPNHLFETPESTKRTLIDAITLLLNGIALVTRNKTVEKVAEVVNVLTKDK